VREGGGKRERDYSPTDVLHKVKIFSAFNKSLNTKKKEKFQTFFER